MSFALRHGRGGSHQFVRQDSSGSTWTSVGLCHKCSRPFIGAFTQTPVCCRACSFVACQGCASNQDDWESKYRCASAKTSVLTYQDLEDIGEPQERSRALPASVQEYRKQLMAKHDQLLDCIRELRATTHKYREEVEVAIRACSDEMGASYSDQTLGSSLQHEACQSPLSPAAGEAGDSGVRKRMEELINQRLTPCTNVLVEQASAVRDLTAQLHSTHSPGPESLTARLLSQAKAGAATFPPQMDASARSERGGPVGHSAHVGHSAQGTTAARAPGCFGSVSAVPIVGVASEADVLDVTRLLHKVYQYRTDQEIEEGLCARLSTVSERRSILPQVEQMLPALTNVILYCEDEMVYLTRELTRLCMSSLHFASRFLWCLRTAWPREPRGFGQRMQEMMYSSDFATPLDARLAKLLWLASYAIVLAGSEPGERWHEEHELLSLAVEPAANKYVSSLALKEAVCRTLRVSDDSLASRALLVPFVTCSPCSVPAHSCLVLSKHQDLAVATEPMQERLLLQPGRYSIEVINLDSGGGSKRTAKVLFALELPGCSPEATTQEVVTGESVVLHLEVPVLARPGASRAGVPHAARAAGALQLRGQGVVGDERGAADGACAKVRVMVQWKDDYQLAFAVRLVVRLELPDLVLSSDVTGMGAQGAQDAQDAQDPQDPQDPAARAAHAHAGDANAQGGKTGGGKSAKSRTSANAVDAHADDDIERAIRLSMETHKQEATRVNAAMQALRAVAHQHKFFEELVDVSRQLVAYRRTVLAGAGGVFARGGEADNTNMALGRQLALRLGALNECIPAGAYLMLGSTCDTEEQILGFDLIESRPLQTPHKVHYMAVVEVGRCARHTGAQDGRHGLCKHANMDQIRPREVPYISCQAYETQGASITTAKGTHPAAHAAIAAGGGASSHNALAESFVVVKDELQEGDGLLLGNSNSTTHSNCSSARPAAAHSERAKSKAREWSASPFGVPWERQKDAVRQRSRFAEHLGSEWDCRSIIVKSHDDMRQDQLAAEFLFLFDRCFKAEKLDLWLRPYGVIATSEDGGILETITDAVAIDTLKKKMSSGGAAVTFSECFEKLFGGKGSQRYMAAQRKFVSSMAAYSVFCYVLHVKDRHNGNILLCQDGAIAHVDFGIMLNVRYAKDVLELKIKLSSEFVQVIGDKMPEFEDACKKGYLAIRKHSRQLFQLLEMSSFSAGAGTALPCLEGDAVDEVRKRLKLGCSDRDAQLHMQAELQQAKGHLCTGLLDHIHNFTHANV